LATIRRLMPARSIEARAFSDTASGPLVPHPAQTCIRVERLGAKSKRQIVFHSYFNTGEFV
jgi:hypothetical protein